MGFRRRYNTPAAPRRSSSQHRTPGAQVGGTTSSPNSQQYSLLQTIMLIAFAVVVLLTNTRFWWFIVESMHFFWTPHTYTSRRINYSSIKWQKKSLASFMVAQKSLIVADRSFDSQDRMHVVKKSHQFLATPLISDKFSAIFMLHSPVADRSLSHLSSASVAVSLLFQNFGTRFWTLSYSSIDAKQVLVEVIMTY